MVSINRRILKGELRVAVSGGVDSVVAAHLLHRLGYPVSIVHFNHKLREQNEVMQHTTAAFASWLGVPCIIGTRLSGELDPKRSEEDQLRGERLKFFDTFFDKIVLGHHLDDAVESYLMRCFTGKPEFIPIPVETQLSNACLVRPFLSSTKDDFLAYAERNKLDKWIVTDDTNTDTKYRRNKIRHDILPQLGEFGLRKIVRKKFYL